MPSKINLLINKWLRENESWQRTLVFLKEEDIILKEGISDFLKNMNPVNSDILKMIEHFHSDLLKESDSARLLRKEVEDMKNQLSENFYEDSDWLSSLKLQQRRLRTEMQRTEMEFLELKFNLNNYLEQILQSWILE